MRTMRDAFTDATSDILVSDPRSTLVLADIGAARFTGVPGVHNVGIREQAMIGVAAGLALSGLRPIVHSYAPFLVERPFEQIKLDFGHQGLAGVFVSIGASYDAASEGRTHQSPGDVAMLSTLPDWTIQIPGHPDEVDAMLRAAVAGEGCVYLRLSDDVNAMPHPATGKVNVMRHGSRRSPTVIAVGPMLDRVVEATAELDVTLVYVNTVQPFDRAGLAEAVSGSEVVLVEPTLEGTSSAEVTTALADRPIRLCAIGVPRAELRRYGSRRDHDAAHGLDVVGLRERIGVFVGG